MARLALNFPGQVQAASSASIDPDVAVFLYQATKDLPGTETCMDMVNEDHISISGPWLPSHPNIVTAVDLDSGSLLVVSSCHPHHNNKRMQHNLRSAL